MTAFKVEYSANQLKSKTIIDLKNHRLEFETARMEAEKAAMRYSRRRITSIK